MFSRLTFFIKKHFLPERLKVDRGFMITIIVIVLFGLLMLTSASSIIAYSTYDDAYYFLKHQLVSVTIGICAFWITSRIDYKHLRKIAFFLLLSSLALLILVFIPGLGREVNGSRSWINFFGFSLQPAEFVKLTFIIYLAALFEKTSDTPKRFTSFIWMYGIIALLMLLQPDIGTLFILSITAFTVYYIGGGKIKHILTLIGIGVVGLILIIVAGQGYRLDRFRCVFNNDYSPQGSCYQINQSLIAVGSGGIFGRGLGESRQKFLFLPEVQNDFIFAIIAEETGLIFGIVLIGLFGFLFYRTYSIANATPDSFGRNLCVGVGIWLIVQVILNIGGIISFLPMTGVPLPLISYGGSAIISAMAGLGIIAGISKQVYLT
jgi:cell division protein FtsW